jgi:hypothetical protein
MKTARWEYLHPDGRRWRVYAPSKPIAAQRVAPLFAVDPTDAIHRLERINSSREAGRK